MTVYQLDAAMVRDAVTAARPDSPDDEEAVSSAFARAAWSVLCEPGDGVAGDVVAACGADRALSLLLERADPQRWLDAGGGRLDVGAAEVAAGIERWSPRLSARGVVSALTSAARLGARLVLPGDAAWPSGADDLGRHAPLALWVRGRLAALEPPGGSVAVVGSRDSTAYGEHMAIEIAGGLGDRGFSVVSGAAYGIDAAAHRAALAVKRTTVAFVAGGVDRAYPAGHRDLLTRIAAYGAVVAELPCGASPTRWRFLQRNRLIAACSQAVVVVEAGRRSGSLNTAGHAAALGRPLGAVPGPATSALSAGCHRLLREYDAACVTSADEVAELALGRLPAEQPTLLEGMADDPDAVRVLDALSPRSARAADELARRTGLAPRTVAATLGLLALGGRVRESATGWVRA
ncbi:DNA-processing protein DprA [Cnuibacter physcomitrellae]|uniref:DNA-processing protein DprA n=1 Tax=Cnuibacter physcomitrellae TaxID=1619308 RepID=UPI002175A095|nr:DNA-processing protein DprA [Cnuibacter physcomitrellae]MCS5499042.1 DNA-processing protein DprA [Cnuibacter physcomitrellae]